MRTAAAWAALLPAFVAAVSATEPSPLASAAGRWDMAATGPGLAMVGGTVELGVALEGAEREASLARGGDGRVARFAGGRLELPPGALTALDASQWTVAVRLRDPSGAWTGTIFGDRGDDRQVSVALRAVDGLDLPMRDRNYVGHEGPTVAAWLFNPGGPRSVSGSTAMIEAVWGAREPNTPRVRRIRDLQPKDSKPNALERDVENGVLRVGFPVALLGPAAWHDVVLARTRAKLELWVDGVLVDEEYPIGATRTRSQPMVIGDGFRGWVDHVAVWNRALAPGEIAALAGGREEVRRRERAILGDESPSMQYFRARGINRKAGDLIPYWDAQSGTFRLFYLILRRNMHSKWDGGHGGLEIWQASTKDLKTWTHPPCTIPITEEWEAWNGTGAVAFHDGRYNWFYPTPDYDGKRGGIQRAVSADGVVFAKTEPHPFLEGGDCEVFEEGGLFHMVKGGPTRQAKTPPVAARTLVAWVRLADLDQRGGSALTIEHPDQDQFDGLVFGERSARRWMPGSDRYQRTPAAQEAWPAETAGPDTVVQVAMVCDGGKGRLIRDGRVYAQYDVAWPVVFPAGSSILMGLRHSHATRSGSYFRGRILDARLYGSALPVEQIAALTPDAAGGPEPLAWFDFEDGTARDRSGHYPPGLLHGDARIEGGALILGDGGYLKTPGTLFSQVRLTSKDLESWSPVEGAFIESDKPLGICPNVFRMGDWRYYLCGSGLWRSRGASGPWTEHAPLRLDNLAVPKTAAFGKDRRIYAGFLPDGGWGGNSVLREVVQDAEGRLGTRFVPELIPACGEPLKLPAELRVEASGARADRELGGMPEDYRLEAEVVPGPGATACGLTVRAGGGGGDGCDLVVERATGRVRFSVMTDSAGGSSSGPAIEAVDGLDKAFRIDVVVRHDIVDAEIGGFRSLVTRYWNPGGDRLRLFAEGGPVTFRNVRVRPLEDRYEPYPGWRAAQADDDPSALGFHLMHPGGDSAPGDPNAAFFLDGTCHLHYILQHPWQGKRSFSFVHVTSPDLLHWTWQPTKLQPSFTGHGMFSGTGFLTREGRPAAIYHGQGSGRNQIAIAKDRQLSAWEKPYPVEVRTADGKEAAMRHWDPDCFLVGDTYYAISGGQNPPVFKSKDLKQWTFVGPFLQREMPDVRFGEDVSCANFFPIGKGWMLLCISHPLGCRYYLGDWDAKSEQFVPRSHGRMNWRREDQSFEEPWRDFFAPESVLTPDGRRVMWAWLATLPQLGQKTLQSLPRELNVPDDGILRIRPLRELESLRAAPRVLTNVVVALTPRHNGGTARQRIAELPGDVCEVRITVARAEAEHKQLGFTLFSDGKGGGLPILLRPETRTLRVGATEAPFAVADLPAGEDVVLRIFVDKYLVEVFANDRQAMVAAFADYRGRPGVDAYTFGAPTAIRTVETWRMKAANQGYLEARRNRAWEPATK
ncbi:MAG: hypothetical protein FJ221_00085 [Lentisphaerae bacterium]|nr:hypothetical protein [Lentisphaerota bacterium]